MVWEEKVKVVSKIIEIDCKKKEKEKFVDEIV